MSLPTNECRTCGSTMERREGMFYWRGKFKPGYVCVPCNALYAIPGEEIEPLRGCEEDKR